MAKKYIDADELLNGIYSENPQDVMKYIAEFPAADVRENVRGEWRKGGEQPYFRKHFDIVVCSVCNRRGEQKWNFCPNCGADMRKEEMSE